MPTDSSPPITYDDCGRMQYHPDFQRNHGKRWSRDDLDYLIDNYEIIGPDQMSFALEGTIHTVMQKACKPRKAGKMKPRSINHRHKRTRYL